MSKYVIFFCFLLFSYGCGSECFGGDITPSEIFPGYGQEEYAPESFPKYKQAWDSSFGESMREVDLLKDEMLRHFTESLDWLRGEELSRESLIEIQEVVNSVKYVPEIKDNWQTISQFLDNNNGGDCEEFAIAKAVIIRHLFPRAEVYFALVYKRLAMGLGDRHAIAVVKIQDEVFVLDNDRGIIKMEESSYFTPFFFIDIQSGGYYALYPEEFFHGQIARVE